MSLQLAANHLAAQGRGPDTTLVHMSPREVAGLQALARAHGGSLTINPQTGLPEAGFLDKLLPMIIGAAVTAFTGIPAWQVALGVGGIEAARTGDLSKGIMAGFGAYTGANLGGALSSVGAETLAQEAAKAGTFAPSAEAIEKAALNAVGGGTPALDPSLYGTGVEDLRIPIDRATYDQAAKNVLEREAQANFAKGLSPLDKMSAGIQSLGTEAGRSALVSQLGGPTQAAITAAGVAAPLFAGESARAKMPQTTTPTAYVTPYAFDPNTQALRSLGRYEASKFPGFAAEGGLQKLADGGVAMTPSYQRTSMSPGMLDFADRSEPVVRMRDGGVARFAGEDKSLVSDPGAPLTGQDYADAMANINNLLAQAATEQQARNAAATNTFDSGISAADRAAAEAAMFGGATTTAPAGGGISSLVNTGATGISAPQQIGNTGYSLTTGGDILNSSGAPVTSLTSLSNNAWDPANAALLQAISGSGLTAGPGQLTDLSIGNVGANLPLAVAYNEAQRTGDYTNLNNLLAQRGTSIEDAARTFNLGQKDVTYLKGLTGAKFAKEESEADRVAVTNLYRNVLGRDPDEAGLNYWGSQLAAGKSKEQVAKDFVASANTVLGGMGLPGVTVPTDLTKAFGTYTTPTGYTLTNSATLNRTIGDEWVQNVLGGRAMTDADRKSEWFKATSNAYTAEQMQRAFDAFLKENKIDKSKAPDWYDASKFALSKVVQKPPPVTPTSTFGGTSAVTDAGLTMGGVRDAYVEGGGRIAMPSVNALAPDERPMVQNAVVSAVNDYIAANPGATMAQITAWALANKMPAAQVRAAVNEYRFNQLTGGSKSAYDYLMGRGAYPTSPYLKSGVPVARPYAEAMGLKSTLPTFNLPKVATASTTTSTVGPPTGSYQGLMASDKTALQNALRDAQSSKDYSPLNSLLKAYKLTKADLMAAFPGLSEKDIAAYGDKLSFYEPPAEPYANPNKEGGLLALAGGGNLGKLRDSDVEAAHEKAVKRQDVPRANKLKNEIDLRQRMRNFSINDAPSGLEQLKNPVAQYNQQSDLGGYSDGGRLLRGPGDGVSDSIPATIGGRRPARLADGEFVVPARIVSELGNGSTEAGAKKLYAMMDRIQAGRKKSVGKGKVAVNSRADKHLPA